MDSRTFWWSLAIEIFAQVLVISVGFLVTFFGIKRLLQQSKKSKANSRLVHQCSVVWEKQLLYGKQVVEALREYHDFYGDKLGYRVPKLNALKAAMKRRGMDPDWKAACDWIWSKHTKDQPFEYLEDALDAYRDAFAMVDEIAIPTTDQLELAMKWHGYHIPRRENI